MSEPTPEFLNSEYNPRSTVASTLIRKVEDRQEMSGARNHHSYTPIDLNPPPRALNSLGEQLAEAHLRSTNTQRLTVLGWAFSFGQAPRHAGCRAVLRVPRLPRVGAK